MKIIQKKFCRISNQEEQSKRKAKNNIELFFVNIVFNNKRNLEANNNILIEEMDRIIHKNGIIAKKDYENNTIEISLRKQKCIIKKPADKIDLVMEGWKKKIKKVLPSRMNVNISVDSQKGIIFVELK